MVDSSYQGQYVTVHPKAGLIAIRTHRLESTPEPGRIEKIFWHDFPNSLKGLVER